MPWDWMKVATATGSALPDPNVDAASNQPLPPPPIANKPAPGLKGPGGLSPRTTYTRVNTGAPPTPDAGASDQKSMPPRGLESLPKTAELETQSMNTMAPHPTIQDLIKEALDATAIKVTDEAARLNGEASSGQTKTAAPTMTLTPHDYISDMSNALEFMAKEAEGKLGPGTGPNHMPVSSSPTPPEMNKNHGQAHNQPPMVGASASSGVSKTDPKTGIETNMKSTVGQGPPANMSDKHASLVASNLAFLSKLGGEKCAECKSDPCTCKGKEKKASLEETNLAALANMKIAEDAIFPAHISAGPAPAHSGTPSGVGVPAEPGDVTSQKRMIASNEAAINYTKGQAKAEPKSDLGKVLTEPAQSAATDHTLQDAFDASSKAGVKFASAAPSTLQAAAAQALLKKLAAEASKGKEKKSNMPGSYDLSTPSGQSGFKSSGGM